MNPTVYMISFRRDAQLALWSLRSIYKYLAGDYRVALGVPNCDRGHFEQFSQEFPDMRLFSFDEPPGKGFLTQMLVKCQADMYAPGDEFIHWDSDTMLARELPVETFYDHGKPIVYYGSYASLFPKAPHLRNWQKAVKGALGFWSSHEFMRCFPISFPRSVYPSTRTQVEAVTRRRFDEYVFSTRNEFPQTFAEFNTLGAWAWIKHRQEVAFKEWSKGPLWGWDAVMQFWGPGGPDFVTPHTAIGPCKARDFAKKIGVA